MVSSRVIPAKWATKQSKSKCNPSLLISFGHDTKRIEQSSDYCSAKLLQGSQRTGSEFGHASTASILLDNSTISMMGAKIKQCQLTRFQ